MLIFGSDELDGQLPWFMYENDGEYNDEPSIVSGNDLGKRNVSLNNILIFG